MRGKWELNDQELKFYQAMFNGLALLVKKKELKLVDLTYQDISPIQVEQVLTSLGWKVKNIEIGIELDSWTTFTQPRHEDIILYSSGLTFECVIYLSCLKENFSSKEYHKTL